MLKARLILALAYTIPAWMAVGAEALGPTAAIWYMALMIAGSIIGLALIYIATYSRHHKAFWRATAHMECQRNIACFTNEVYNPLYLLPCTALILWLCSPAMVYANLVWITPCLVQNVLIRAEQERLRVAVNAPSWAEQRRRQLHV